MGNKTIRKILILRNNQSLHAILRWGLSSTTERTGTKVKITMLSEKLKIDDLYAANLGKEMRRPMSMHKRSLMSFLSIVGVLLPVTVEAGPELSFRRCEPISAYQTMIADEAAVKGLPTAQQKHVDMFRQKTGRSLPIYLLEPRPEMNDLTFIPEERECSQLCQGVAYLGQEAHIHEYKFRYKKNFVDHVRISYDARRRFHGYGSGFRSVSFYFLNDITDDVVYFERSAYQVNGAYVDEDPSWIDFFRHARFLRSIERQPAEVQSVKSCLNLDHENEGRNASILLNARGKRAYPMPY